MKSNVAKLALWLILCLVAVGLWQLGAAIVTSIVFPSLVNLPSEERERQYIQFDVDGNPIISAWIPMMTEHRNLRNLDGEPLDLPKDKSPTLAKFREFDLAAAGAPMRVTPVDHNPPALPWSFFSTPLPWDVRLVYATMWSATDMQTWIFRSPDRPEGNGYFVVWNDTRRERIGYLGINGPTDNIPPLDQQFPAFGKTFDEMLRFPNEGHSSDSRNTSESPSQFGGVSLFAISSARDKLFQIQLIGNTVKTIWTGTPGSLRDVFIRSQSSSQGSAMFLILPEEFVQMNSDFEIVRRIRLPEELRGDPHSQQWIEPRPGEHVVVVTDGAWTEVLRKTRIVWFNDAGEVSQRRELRLRTGNHPDIVSTQLKVGTILSVNPIVGLITTVGLGFELRQMSESSSVAPLSLTSLISADVSPALAILWPSLLFVLLLTTALVIAGQRRLNRFGASRFDRWTWGVLILLAGVAGYWAFLVHRRWPRLTPCPGCGHKVPCNQTRCLACDREFPAATPTGCEILG